MAAPPGSGGTSPSTWDVDVALSGTSERLRARISAAVPGGHAARAFVTHYPDHFDLSVKQVTSTAFIPPALDQPFCDVAKRRAESGRDGDRSLALSLLRRSGAVVLQLDFAPPLFPSTHSALLAATQKADAAFSSLTVDNTLQLGSVDVQVRFDSEAMSNILGNAEADLDLANSVVTLNAASQGRAQIAVAAQDVLCDLWSRKARVVLTWKGTVDGVADTATSTMTGLAPD